MDTNPVPNQTNSSSPAPAAGTQSAHTAWNDQERRQRRLDALIKGIDWSHVIIGQVARLHQARQAAQQSEQARRDRRDYAQQDQQPFAWLRAEAYFLLGAGAARQLVRALAAYGDTKNVPAFVPGRVGVRCQATGSASVPVLSRVAHRGQHCGAVSMLAGVLPVDDLVAWAHEIQAYLLQAEREWR